MFNDGSVQPCSKAIESNPKMCIFDVVTAMIKIEWRAGFSSRLRGFLVDQTSNGGQNVTDGLVIRASEKKENC